jgi:hypothetical protein
MTPDELGQARNDPMPTQADSEDTDEDVRDAFAELRRWMIQRASEPDAPGWMRYEL